MFYKFGLVVVLSDAPSRTPLQIYIFQDYIPKSIVKTKVLGVRSKNNKNLCDSNFLGANDGLGKSMENPHF